MLLLPCADEAVERDVQALVHLLEPAGVARGDFQRRHFLGLRGLDHLQAVLVGAGEEEHILAVEPLKARQRIGRDRLIGVTDMRHAVRVGDRGRDVVGIAFAAGGFDFTARGTGFAAVAFADGFFCRSDASLRDLSSRLSFALLFSWLLSSPPSSLPSLQLSLRFSWPASPHVCFSSRVFSTPRLWWWRAAFCELSSPYAS